MGRKPHELYRSNQIAAEQRKQRTLGKHFNTSKRITMGTTYTNLLFHIVFGTKHRKNIISPQIPERLYEYIV